VECIGVNLGLPERYRHDRLVAFDELPARIGGFDIGIAPLADLRFNRARSDIKLKEYAASGVPWLASPVGPYLGLGEAEGGRLVSDGDWFEALDRLLSQQREREQLGLAGEAWARRQTIDVAAGRWERVFAEAAGVASGAERALRSGARVRVRLRGT
jgi:glycosyltransferase involved in cell wall biosynthesis